VSDPIRPDDLARSKSGRVPQWVVDEAKGVKVEPVPFRAATPPASLARAGRGKRALRGVVTLVGVAGLVALTLTTDIGRGLIGSSSVNAVQAPDGPALGHEEAGNPLGTPPPIVLPSESYQFLSRQADDKTPVRWSPCRPIHYVVRQANAPANGQRMIEDAFARVSAATGFRFVNDGGTKEGPRPHREAFQQERYGKRWAPVLVAWATHDEVPDFGVEFAGEASAVGMKSGSGDVVYVSGTVYLDPFKIQQVTTRDGEAQARAIILHELGHLVGLAHVNDPGEIMAPRVSRGVTEFQPGDRTGLNELASGPCQKDV
jgi:hypothetical protein